MALFKRKGGETGGGTAAAEKPKPTEQDWREVQKAKNEALRKAVPQALTMKMKETGEKPKIAEIQLSLKEATESMGTKKLQYESADGSVKVHFTKFGYKRNYVTFEKFAGKDLEFGFVYKVGDPKDAFLSMDSFEVGKLSFNSVMAGMFGSRVALVIPPEADKMRETLKLASDKADEIKRIHDEVGGAVHDALKPLASQVLTKLEELS